MVVKQMFFLSLTVHCLTHPSCIYFAQIAKMVSMLKKVYEHKNRSEHRKMRERAAEHEKKMSKINNARQQKQKEVKKQAYRILGKMNKRKNQTGE